MMVNAGGPPLRLAYSDPRGAGTPILFLHGFGHNRSVWEGVTAELPSALRPIAIDLRGHGESPWDPDGDYAPNDYARDLPLLMDALGIDQAAIVGHSLGGNVATLFAAAAPKRVRALVLVDTGPSLELSGISHVVDELGSALKSHASVAEFRAQLALTHPKGDPNVLDRLAATGIARRLDGRFEPAFDPGVLAGANPVEASAALRGLEAELWAALRGLRCPVLVVRGGVSSILSEKVAMEMVDEALSRGRLVTLPNAGHSVMIDEGAGLRDALLEFLSESID